MPLQTKPNLRQDSLCQNIITSFEICTNMTTQTYLKKAKHPTETPTEMSESPITFIEITIHIYYYHSFQATKPTPHNFQQIIPVTSIYSIVIQRISLL